MRTIVVLVIATSLVVGTLSGTAHSAARDCTTEGASYPRHGRAEGATFVGVSTGRTRNDQGSLVYTFDVRRVFAGDIGSTVRVEIVCMPTRFRPGRTFLVSSGAYRPTDGRPIVRLVYSRERAVAWRVFPDRTVRLLDRTVRLKDDRTNPPPFYLWEPDTVREAVAAVTSD